MSHSLPSLIPHVRALSLAENITAFIVLTTVRKKLEMLAEVLDLADAQGEPLRCTGALAGIVENQIAELERLCDKLCPVALEG
ncbi:MAG: hypothetical protein K2J64_07825 [Desulfovibrio sp.]|nr:hypothetical protein [Desulfovibrio sp.]